MSDSENHHHGKNEIIIIKRHGGDHDGHHGGAWKIAYADFMTAMMAFFLVMWLVNAANEETKASVASYFNPIKLSDETPASKGLKKPVNQAEGEQKQDQGKGKDNPESGGSAAAGEEQNASAGQEQNYSEADYFENPYSVLAEIAQEVGQQANVSVKGEGGASDSGPATGANGGEAYRDPFDPDFWNEQVAASATSNPAKAAAAAADQADPAPQDQQQQQMASLPASDPTDPTATLSKPDTAPVSEEPVAEDIPVPQQKPSAAGTAKAGETRPAEGETETAAADAKGASAADMQAAEDLKQAITREIGGVAGKLAEGLIVTPAEGGMLITISDQLDTPMFNIGSPVPRKEMVLAMEKIGKLLTERPGKVVIRGHTDGRPFKGGGGDNWQLSTARAESAYYMLTRGGLDEKRVEQVSGFADRRLMVPENPLDDRNRRIEILLQADKG